MKRIDIIMLLKENEQKQQELEQLKSSYVNAGLYFRDPDENNMNESENCGYYTRKAYHERLRQEYEYYLKKKQEFDEWLQEEV